MHNRKLIRLLKTLTEKEFLQLGKFLQSSFFNTNKQVIRLFDFFKDHKHYPDFDHPDLSKEWVDKTLFQGNDYSFDPKRIRDLMSDLSVLVEEYMILIESRNKADLTKDQLLLKAFSKRNLYKLFKIKTDSVISRLEKQRIRNVDYYRNLFTLNHQFFFHPDTLKHQPATKNINAVLESLDTFYALAKLRITCELLSREQIFSEHYNNDLIQEVMHIALEKYSNDNQLFLIYTGLIELFSKGYVASTYAEIKSYYFEKLDTIGKEEQKVILHYLINIVLTVLYSNKKIVPEVFDLYQLGLKHNILIHNMRLTPATYSNIVILGSTLKHFDWTQNFIETHEKYLDLKIREETKLMSQAYFYFNKTEYDKAFDLISNHKLPSELYNIRSRGLLVRILMEKFLLDSDFHTLLTSKIESLRKKIERSKSISDNKKKAYHNFVIYIRRLTILLRTKPKRFKNSLEKLKKEIQTDQALVAKAWLLVKIDFLLEKI